MNVSPTEVETIIKSEVPPAYRELLTGSTFPIQKIRELTRIRHGRVSAELVLIGVLLGGVPWLYGLLPHPLTFVVCFILNIRAFNCLAQMVHASDHGALVDNPDLNIRLGNISAYCLGYTRTGHRRAHLNHHYYLNTAADPDLIWGRPDEGSRELFRKWLRDLLLVSAIARFLQYSQSDRSAFSVAPWRTLTLSSLASSVRGVWPIVAAQGVILAYYSVVLGPVYYVALYMLPIMTLYPAIIRMRSTVEHSFETGYRPESSRDVWVVRSTRGYALERFILAPLGTQHHFEHHLFPTVPHYNLGKVQELLSQYSVPVPIVRSYLGFILQKINAERRSATSGGAV
jgi:fatty acid desaturase